MIQIEIPGREELRIEHVLLDYNGIIAHADVLARSASEGLDLLLKPDRLRATLRT